MRDAPAAYDVRYCPNFVVMEAEKADDGLYYPYIWEMSNYNRPRRCKSLLNTNIWNNKYISLIKCAAGNLIITFSVNAPSCPNILNSGLPSNFPVVSEKDSAQPVERYALKSG
jgi:hypothetical protein